MTRFVDVPLRKWSALPGDGADFERGSSDGRGTVKGAGFLEPVRAKSYPGVDRRLAGALSSRARRRKQPVSPEIQRFPSLGKTAPNRQDFTDFHRCHEETGVEKPSKRRLGSRRKCLDAPLLPREGLPPGIPRMKKPMEKSSSCPWTLLFLLSMLSAKAAETNVAPVPLPRVLRPDLGVELFCREPDIVTPIQFDVDRRGRVWVIESNTHFPKDDYHRHPSDRLLILEDADHDGKADRIGVFADGFHQSMALSLRGEGEVYFATRREVMLLRDTDG